MSQFSYDVAVAYRIYPKVSTNCGNHPPIFREDKLKLAEFCLKSFKKSLGGLRVKLWVILNDCPPEYEEMIRRVWGSEHLVLVRFPGVSGSVTLDEAARILREQIDAGIVYFSDDDYFYLPGQFHLAVDFLKQNPDADFIAPYESSDFYTIDLHNMRFERREFGGKEWISCISTTHTFLTRRFVLIEIRRLYLDMYRSWSCRGNKGPFDLAFWVALTKKRVFNPVKFTQWLLTRRLFWAGSILIAWNDCWRQILFGRRYTLWSPHPCIATHMVAGLEAPGIEWAKEFQRQMASVTPEALKD